MTDENSTDVGGRLEALVMRLRDIHAVGRIADCVHTTQTCEEAADEIEHLRSVLADWLSCADSPDEWMRCRDAAKRALGA